MVDLQVLRKHVIGSDSELASELYREATASVACLPRLGVVGVRQALAWVSIHFETQFQNTRNDDDRAFCIAQRVETSELNSPALLRAMGK